MNIKSTPDEIIKQGFSTSSFYAPAGVSDKVKTKLDEVTGYDNFVNILQNDTGLDYNSAQTIAGSTLFGFLEQEGVNVNEWKLTVDPIELGKVKYGPEEFEDARKFLGSWTKIAEISLFIASIGALIVAGIATYLSAKTLPLLLLALRTGKGLKSFNVVLNLVKVRSIKWLALPAIVTTIATLWSQLAGTQITATGDLTTYVKQGVARGYDKLDEVQSASKKFVKTDAVAKPTFIPTFTKTKSAKPKIFIGTVFGDKVANVPEFVRNVDDEILNEEEMINDFKSEMTNWLQALPGKMTYEIQVKNNPFDEMNVKKQGHWLTVGVYLSGKAGKRIFVDEFLLGPIDPVKYWPDTIMTESLRMAVTEHITPEILTPSFSPDGKVRTVDKTGNVVSIFPSVQEEKTIGRKEVEKEFLEREVTSEFITKRVQEIEAQQALLPEKEAPVNYMYNYGLTVEQNIDRALVKEGDYVPGMGILSPLGIFIKTPKEIPIIDKAPLPFEPTQAQLEARKRGEVVAEPLPEFIKTGDYFVSREGFSQSGNLYRIKNDVLLSFIPSDYILTQEERRSAGNFGGQISAVIPKLQEKGLDPTKLRTVPYITDILSKYSDKRRSVKSFDEFVA